MPLQHPCAPKSHERWRGAPATGWETRRARTAGDAGPVSGWKKRAPLSRRLWALSQPKFSSLGGGTEANNLAVLGRTRHEQARANPAPLVVTSKIEHPAVLRAAEQAVQEGGRHSLVGLRDGVFDMQALQEALGAKPALVSCMWVNNEVGLILPLDEVAECCRKHRVPLHSDAVQGRRQGFHVYAKH